MRRTRKVVNRRRRNQKRQRQCRRRRGRINSRKTWLDCVRHFLTTHFWRVSHQNSGCYHAARWKLMMLLLVCMMSMFGRAKAGVDRFEEARAYYVAMYPHGKRPGKTLEGFLAALARLPRYLFKAVQPVLRERVARVLEGAWWVDGWIPFSVDGSRLALPRYAALERHFGTAGTGDFPHMWVTSIVHLATGVPWSWRFGRSDASERHQFRYLIPTLPERSLVMADAGYVGYEVWEALMKQNKRFLIRLGANVQLYADYEVRPDFQEGWVYLWPKSQPSKTPLKLRLIRVSADNRNEIWLASNTTSEQLSHQSAGRMYRLRWEQEVFYRSYKCTLQKTKLSSRTTRQAVREVELAMLATQLLMAQSAWAVSRKDVTRSASCAQALRQIHREWRYALRHGKLRQRFLERLGKATREQRPQRKSAKNYRQWPRKRPHKPPGRPQIAGYPDELKDRLAEELRRNEATAN